MWGKLSSFVRYPGSAWYSNIYSCSKRCGGLIKCLGWDWGNWGCGLFVLLYLDCFFVCKSCEVFSVISAEVLQSHKLDLLTYLPKFETLLVLRSLPYNKGNFFPKWLLRNMFTLILVLGRIVTIFPGITLQFLLL